MFHRLSVPEEITADSIIVDQVLVKRKERVYRDQTLIVLVCGRIKIPIVAPDHGFVSYISVQLGQKVSQAETLLMMDIIDVSRYRPDEQQVNPESELGQHGRRALERELLKKFGNGFSAPLFEAPAKEGGLGSHRELRSHPLLQRMKEGVPPKMRAEASNNQPAIDQLAENATHDNELRLQLSQQLQQQLNISPSPVNAPKLTR